MKSGSVKGQFTVPKGRSGRPLQPKMLKGALSSFCLSFVFFHLVSLSRGSLVHLKHRGESASGMEVGTPLPQQLVQAGM